MLLKFCCIIFVFSSCPEEELTIDQQTGAVPPPCASVLQNPEPQPTFSEQTHPPINEPSTHKPSPPGLFSSSPFQRRSLPLTVVNANLPQKHSSRAGGLPTGYRGNSGVVFCRRDRAFHRCCYTCGGSAVNTGLLCLR